MCALLWKGWQPHAPMLSAVPHRSVDANVPTKVTRHSNILLLRWVQHVSLGTLPDAPADSRETRYEFACGTIPRAALETHGSIPLFRRIVLDVSLLGIPPTPLVSYYVRLAHGYIIPKRPMRSTVLRNRVLVTPLYEIQRRPRDHTVRKA